MRGPASNDGIGMKLCSVEVDIHSDCIIGDPRQRGQTLFRLAGRAGPFINDAIDPCR